MLTSPRCYRCARTCVRKPMASSTHGIAGLTAASIHQASSRAGRWSAPPGCSRRAGPATSASTAVAAVLQVTHLAVATSGYYERGDHIVDARTGMPNGDLLSLTVAGPSLTL